MRTQVFITFLLIIIAASSTAFAQDVTYASTNGTVEFRANGHPSALHVVGKGEGPQGKLVLNRDQVSGSVNFDLNSLNTGIDLRDEHMKNKYLEVGKYPQAQLMITQCKLPQPLKGAFTSATAVPFKGILKLHGVEKPITGSVDLKSAAPGKLQTIANFGLKLTDFGIVIPKFMGITIADDVQVTVDATPQF